MKLKNLGYQLIGTFDAIITSDIKNNKLIKLEGSNKYLLT